MLIANAGGQVPPGRRDLLFIAAMKHDIRPLDFGFLSTFGFRHFRVLTAWDFSTS